MIACWQRLKSSIMIKIPLILLLRYHISIWRYDMFSLHSEPSIEACVLFCILKRWCYHDSVIFLWATLVISFYSKINKRKIFSFIKKISFRKLVSNAVYDSYSVNYLTYHKRTDFTNSNTDATVCSICVLIHEFSIWKILYVPNV